MRPSQKVGLKHNWWLASNHFKNHDEKILAGRALYILTRRYVPWLGTTSSEVRGKIGCCVLLMILKRGNIFGRAFSNVRIKTTSVVSETKYIKEQHKEVIRIAGDIFRKRTNLNFKNFHANMYRANRPHILVINFWFNVRLTCWYI